MKTWNSLIAIIIMLSGTAVYAQKVEIDQNKSTIEWMGKKLGRKHVGNIQLMSGNLELKDNGIVAGNFVADMKTITVTDVKDEGSNKKLVGHLKSDDFFGVEKYTTANFKVTESSEFINGLATVTGEITIKGKTEPISFEVVRNGNEYRANIEIDRSKFDVRYGSNSFFDNLGDSAIDNIFTLDIKVVAR
jgi:polyisoprenoid-binding protein YceI